MADEIKHSAEPWEVPEELPQLVVSKARPDESLLGINETGLYRTDSGGMAVFANEHDARRVVAAVNACAGLPTEALEAGVLTGAIGLLRSLWTGEDLMGEVHRHVEATLRALGRIP